MIAGQWRYCIWIRAKGSAACNIVWYQLKELSFGIWTGQTGSAVNEHVSFLLQSQPSVLSYSILDNKCMVLFCCLKNMCWVITNICALQSKPSQGSQTLMDMVRHQCGELITLKQKNKSSGATWKAEVRSHSFKRHISKRNAKGKAWLCICCRWQTR